MEPTYSLEHLTLIGCSAPELVYTAARAGYDAVSLRLIPMGVEGEFACHPSNRDMMRATRNALAETGLRVHAVELARILAEVEPEAYEPALAVAAELGARHVISSAWTQRRDDRDLIVDRFGRICDLAARYGQRVALEFPCFSRLRTLDEAADIVRVADRPNGGILIDTIYAHFSHLDPAALDALPADWFQFIHVADVPAPVPETRDGMVHIARDDRLYPGEGAFDFTALVDHLPPVVYAIELPNLKRVAELGHEEHARRCLRAAQAVLGGGPRTVPYQQTPGRPVSAHGQTMS